jgi:hypothetical protein
MDSFTSTYRSWEYGPINGYISLNYCVVSRRPLISIGRKYTQRAQINQVFKKGAKFSCFGCLQSVV